MIELEKICSSNIQNSPLRALVEQLQNGLRSEVDVLRMTPETAQKSWHHHTDHSDYSEQKHTDSSNPQHGDYCD